MKFFLLLTALFTAGFFMQRDRKKSVDTQAPPVSQTSSMVFCSPAFDPYKLRQGEAPIFKGLGNLKYTVSTSSAKAQKYFNQGLTLLYAFNHAVERS